MKRNKVEEEDKKIFSFFIFFDNILNNFIVLSRW